MTLVALIGNGLSIAIEPRFNCKSLTVGLQEKFTNAGLVGADAALRNLAEKLGSVGGDSGFEEMLGPLEAARGVLGGLYELASTLRSSMPSHSDTILESLRKSEKFSDLFYRLGSTGILQLIEEISEGVDMTLARKLVDELYEVARPASLTIGTLNYDAILLSAVLALDEEKRGSGEPHFLADMADGRYSMYHQVTPASEILGNRIRRDSRDLPSWPLTLLALHGSLTWLRDTRSKDVWKFKLEDIRNNADFWREILRSSEWEPAVIMTNQTGKSSRVTEHPFRLAYEVFEKRLTGASRWLIAGYGFGDECVNAVLAKAASASPDTKCLVVSHKGSPTNDKVNNTLHGVSNLFVFDGDFGDLFESGEWSGWKS